MNNQIQLVLKSSTTELSLNDRELGIYLTPELEGLTGLPEIRTTSGVNAGYDGGWTSAQNYDARSITIRGVIANEDVATVEQLRRQLTTLAGQGKNEELTLDLVTQAGKAYTIQVRTIALEMSLQKVLTQQEFMLQLRADDPLVYDASETTHEALLRVAQATGGFTIDFELPLAITGSSEETVVNNEGLEQVPTITRMYGALHNPKIINQTTNQFMQIEADLGFAEGDWIEPSEVVSGKDITINGAPEGAPFSQFDLKSNTEQADTPTPDSPVPVKVVTGENVVKINGKNLFNLTTPATNNGVTVTANADGSFTINGTTTGVAVFNFILPALKPAGTYTISCTSKNQVMPNSFYIRARNQNMSMLVPGGADGPSQIVGNGTNYAEKTFISTDPMYCLALNLTTTGVTYNNMIIYPQVEVGSAATAYEPYRSQSYEVNLGKNLFDKNNYTDVTGHYIGSSGKYNSTSNGHVAIVQIEPNMTYTVSKVAQESNNRLRVGIADELVADGTTFSIWGGSDSATSVTLTSGSNSKYMYIYYAVNANVDAALETLQIEKGSQVTSYAAYFEPIELCKIGDYQDSIYKSDGKWYVHKVVDKLVLTGSESNYMTRSNTSTTHSKFRINSNVLSAPIATTTSILCTNFVANTGANAQAYSGNAICGSVTANFERQLWFSIDNTIASTVDAFKTWVTNNTPTVYYALATPTDTEITNEALVAQLEALAAATMYNPQTNITTLYADGNEQPTLDVSYFTDKNPDTRDELVIDSRLRTITLNGLDVYHLQAPGSEFLMLAPGENRLALQSDITGDNGYAQVSYKQGYLSI